jgi:TPR repeat protein
VAGNDRAQHNLATMHMEGEGGPYNPPPPPIGTPALPGRAVTCRRHRWVKCIWKGRRGCRPEKAIALLEQAAGTGNEAAVVLGKLYSEGIDGLPKNGEKARDWYQQGAERNFRLPSTGLPSSLHPANSCPGIFSRQNSGTSRRRAGATPRPSWSWACCT